MRRKSVAPVTRVLIAGDDKALRTSVAASLRGAGYTVNEASTVPEALGILFTSASPLVVLFDLSCLDLLNVVPPIRRLARKHAYVMLCPGTLKRAAECESLIAQLTMLVLHKPYDQRALLNTVARAQRALTVTEQ